MKLEDNITKINVRWDMLLSHHPPSQYDRVYKIGGVKVCARCIGFPIGFVISYYFCFDYKTILLFLLPLPTFIQFTLQELNFIKSRNYLKTFLTSFLGMYFFKLFKEYIILEILFGVLYIFTLIFITAYVLNKYEKLDNLVKEYENGMYK